MLQPATSLELPANASGGQQSVTVADFNMDGEKASTHHPTTPYFHNSAEVP